MRTTSFLLLLAFLKIAWSQKTCIDDIADIYVAEEAVTDLSVTRTYVLCPRRIFEVGKLDFEFNLQGFQVMPPLPLRSNMKIMCGDTGSRDGLCWIAEGDIHMDATKLRGINDESVDNVEIEGIVFLGAQQFSLWADKPGSIVFRDCEWKDHTEAVAPIMLDWFDADNSDAVLSVIFVDCLFHNNRFFGQGSQTALIYANSAQNELVVRRTIFENNDMVTNNTQFATNSFIIETLGPLKIEDSCFQNNTVGVSNAVIFGNTFVDSRNYNFNSTGSLCEFGAVFETLQQFDEFKPLCVSSSPVSSCSAALGLPTETPTTSPTLFPTSSTVAPSVFIPPTSPPTAMVPATDKPVASPSVDGTDNPKDFAWPSNLPTGMPAEGINTSDVAAALSSGIWTLSILSLLGLLF